MDRPNTPKCLLKIAVVILIAMTLSQAGYSQKMSKIAALNPNAALSPTNTQDYAEMVKQYMAVACIGKYDPNCIYKANDSKRLRDALVFVAKAQADIAFSNYRTGRRHKSQAFNLFLDILEIAASTAISITNGERAKSIIADGLTFLQLSQRSVNKNLMLLETQVLFNSMEAKRARIYERILKRLTEDDRTYSFPAALADIVLYAKAGTIDEALADLAQTSASQKTDADASVVTAETTYFASVATLKQAADAKAGFKMLNSLANEILVAASTAAAFGKSKAIAAEIDANHKAIIDADPTLSPLMATIRTEAAKVNADGAKLPNAINALRAALAANGSFKELYESVNEIILIKGK